MDLKKKRERREKKTEENWLNHLVVCRLRLTLECYEKEGGFFDDASKLFSRMSRVLVPHELVAAVTRIHHSTDVPTYYPPTEYLQNSPFKQISLLDSGGRRFQARKAMRSWSSANHPCGKYYGLPELCRLRLITRCLRSFDMQER